MRWLMIGFLVSLAALLVAAAGLARHIWLHRVRLQSNSDSTVASLPTGESEADFDPVDKIDRDL